MPTLPELLKTTVDLGGVGPAPDDGHAAAGARQQQRRGSEMGELTPSDTKQLAYSVLTDAQKKRFEETSNSTSRSASRASRALPLQPVQPARRGSRRLPVDPRAHPLVRGARAPQVLTNLADRPRGLVLVTGPTGSGVDDAGVHDRQDQRERREHILTIEDPISTSAHKNCLVNQREVHSDTNGFSIALRAALREDPTSSSSAKCATSRRSSPRCASPRRAT